MFYYAITFQAILDGHDTQTGMIGIISKNNDYLPNTIKNDISKYYRRLFPSTKSVAVRIIDVKRLTEMDYENIKPSFINWLTLFQQIYSCRLRT